MVVSDGATFRWAERSTIPEILCNSEGAATELQILADGITLQGFGHLTLSGAAGNEIVGTTATSTFTSVDITIAGVGQIGSGDSTLTLINQAHGTIDANTAGSTLTLATMP
jgi:hypothetical protein